MKSREGWLGAILALMFAGTLGWFLFFGQIPPGAPRAVVISGEWLYPYAVTVDGLEVGERAYIFASDVIVTRRDHRCFIYGGTELLRQKSLGEPRNVRIERHSDGYHVFVLAGDTRFNIGVWSASYYEDDDDYVPVVKIYFRDPPI